MSTQGEEYSLFPRKRRQRSKSEASSLHSNNHIIQPHAYFSSKRNSSGIEHYFIEGRSRIKNFIGIGSFVVVTILTIVCSQYLLRTNYESNTIEMAKRITVPLSSQISLKIKFSTETSLIMSQFLADMYPSLLENLTGMSVQRLVFNLFNYADQASDPSLDNFEFATKTGQYYLFQNKENFLYYLNGSSDTEGGTLKRWYLNDTAGFPYTNGTDRGTLNLLDFSWYAVVKSSKLSYTLLTHWNEPLVNYNYFLGASPIYINKSFYGVFSNRYPVSEITKLIDEKIPSQNSHMAFVTADEIISIDRSNYNERDYEYYLPNIFSLQEPYWKEATRNFRYKKGYIYSAAVGNKNLTYYASSISLSLTNDDEWEIITLLCVSDFMEENNSISYIWIILLIVDLVLFVLILAVNFLISWCQSTKQSNIFGEPNPTTSNYDVALNLMEKLQRTHLVGSEPSNVAKRIIKDLQNPLIYNVNLLSCAIEDEKVKEDFQNKFMHPQTHNSERVAGICRIHYLKENISACKNSIYEAFKVANNDVFNPNQLQTVIEELIAPLPETNLKLLADAINFAVCYSHFQSDLVLAILLSLLCFHLTQYSNQFNVYTKLFISDSLKITDFAVKMVSLFESREENERHNFVFFYMFKFCESAPLCEQQRVKSTALYKQDISNIANLISNTAQTSYLEDPTASLSNILLPIEDEVRSSFFNQSLHVIKNFKI